VAVHNVKPTATPLPNPSAADVEAQARARLAREVAGLPEWASPAFWARVRGQQEPGLSLGVLAHLIAEAQRHGEPESARELFTRLLILIEQANQRWFAAMIARTPGLYGAAAYAVREDLCQELALRLWQRLAFEPTESWQLYFQLALDYERRHVAVAYMERNGLWVRAAVRASGHGPARAEPAARALG
jgi:hypothetical protein